MMVANRSRRGTYRDELDMLCGDSIAKGDELGRIQRYAKGAAVILFLLAIFAIGAVVDGWILFVGIAFQGAALFHYWAREHCRWLPIAITVIVAGIGLVFTDAYPEFWPRGRGIFTPNRVCAALGYILIFGGSAMYGAYKTKSEAAATYWARLRERL